MESGQAVDECGCAPTARERRALWPAVSRRGALGLGALGLVDARRPSPARCSRPPSPRTTPRGTTCRRAKANEAAKAAEVTKIQGLIQGLEPRSQRTQAAAQVASDAFYVAQQAYFDAA